MIQGIRPFASLFINYYESWRFHSNYLIQTRHSRPSRGNRMACVKIPMRLMMLSCVVVHREAHGDLSGKAAQQS